ncbi:hypothetical protein GCM10022226_17180 [Sphaerisporangium flaviroseum]|uniref:PQQ-like domain-containing protein n=1 Tax=Sphaerisporangium flaviroseum TaxID=509199 RepID=A0ABP7HNI4_9ACTN
MRVREAAAFVTGLVALVTGCSLGTGGEGPSVTSTAPRPPRVLHADAGGAVVFDPAAATISGVDRVRGRIWQDREISETATDIMCLARCPAVVVSTSQAEIPPSPAVDASRDGAAAPFQLTAQGRAPFPVSGTARVLTAVSPGDTVVEEVAGGRTWITIVRPGGRERIAVPHSGYRWVEAADRSAALAFSTRPDARDGRLLRFAREPDGWKQVGEGLQWGPITDACLAGHGETALVTGAETALVRWSSGRVPVDRALAEAGECALGTGVAALISRAVSVQGDHRTVVYGLDPTGRSTWRREFAAEVGVTAHPSEPYLGISDGRTFALVDARGETVWTRDAVTAARFTSDGQLVVVAPDGEVRWLPADLIGKANAESP